MKDSVLVIDNLDYKTLVQIFGQQYLYDTDRIIVKYKHFTQSDIIEALGNQIVYMASKHFPMDNQGKVVDLLSDMLADSEDDNDTNCGATAISEAIYFRQCWLYGFRNTIYKDGVKSKTYFNPKATVEIQFYEDMEV